MTADELAAELETRAGVWEFARRMQRETEPASVSSLLRAAAVRLREQAMMLESNVTHRDAAREMRERCAATCVGIRATDAAILEATPLESYAGPTNRTALVIAMDRVDQCRNAIEDLTLPGDVL